jgi:hypothetical protein
MRLPEPIERLLEPGPERLPDPGLGRLGKPRVRVHDRGVTCRQAPLHELPPWNAGPYKQDVPRW